MDAPLVSPVLLVTNQLDVGGAERYVVTVANWLAAHGARAAVAATPGHFQAALGPGVVFHPIPMRSLKLGVPRAAARLARVIAAERPRVIVANSVATAWAARLAQGPRRRIPIVLVAHGWPAAKYRLVAPPARVADVVVAVSPDVRRQLIAHGLPADRCVVVHNGVDLTPFHARDAAARQAARAALGAGPDDVAVVNVGRLAAQKAHHHVVAIAAALRDRHPGLRFALIGDGELRGELEAAIAAAGVGDRVRLLGERSDIADLLAGADVYLSTSDWEGMPLSTIEAMASSLPIVSTRTEGAEVLLDPSCAVVVPVGDTAAMADAVARLAADAALRRRRGAAARARAEADFSHERVGRELARIAAGLVGAR